MLKDAGVWRTWRTTVSCTGEFPDCTMKRAPVQCLAGSHSWIICRFPSTSPLKQIPVGPAGGRKQSTSLKDRESFFKLKGSRKFDKEIQVSFPGRVSCRFSVSVSSSDLVSPNHSCRRTLFLQKILLRPQRLWAAETSQNTTLRKFGRMSP